MVVVILVGVTIISCTEQTQPQALPERPQLVVVGVDGATWDVIDRMGAGDSFQT